MDSTSFYILIIQLTVFLRGGCYASCTYPLSWRRVTWFHHYDNDLIMYLYSYEQNGLIRQRIRGANIPGLNIYFQCRKEITLRDQRWYGAELNLQGNPTGHLQCMHIIPDVRVLLERPTKVDSLSECPQEEDTEAGFNVMVPHPFDFSSGSCPFTHGTFQVTYNADSQTTQVCSGIEESEVTITKKFIKLNTCNQVTDDYEQPYRADLRCVETFSADTIDSTANGDVLILARQMASQTFFYCARYKIQGDVMYMSVDVTNRQTVNCLPGVSHLTFGVQGQHVHRGFIFSDLDKMSTSTHPAVRSTSVRSSTVTASVTSPASSSSQMDITTSLSTSTSSKGQTTTVTTPVHKTTGLPSTATDLIYSNSSRHPEESSNKKLGTAPSDLPLHIIIIMSVLCVLAAIIVIIVLGSVAYCKIRNKKQEEERPPEVTEESDLGPVIVALDNDNGSGVRTWYPEYTINSANDKSLS